jgi:hypothetical protein
MTKEKLEEIERICNFIRPGSVFVGVVKFNGKCCQLNPKLIFELVKDYRNETSKK